MAASPRVQLSSPRFVGYLVAQFLGALNDNAFKLTLVLFGLATMQTEAEKVVVSSLITALFPLPWLLFSQLAGYLADRYRKDRVLLATKLPEVAFMALGALGFHLDSLPLLMGVFLLMSAQSAFFSPAKYGILPEVLGQEDLAEANGVLSMTTNLATLLGTVLGIEVYGWFRGELVLAGGLYVGIAILGTLATLYIPRAPLGHAGAQRPANPIASLRSDASALRAVPSLTATVAGLAYFSFLGSLLLAVIPIYGSSALGLGDQMVGRLLVPLVLGIAVGSVLAGWLSRGRVELGLVPLGSVLMAGFSLHLWLRGAASKVDVLGLPLGPVVDLTMLGFGAGFFNVPLTALLQQRSPDDQKGKLIGFSNVVSNLAILAAAGCGIALSLIEGFDIHYTLAALTLVTIAGTLHIVWLLPDFLVRLLVYLIVNVLYRLRVVGAENIPRSGALFVANHVSWIDAVLVAAASGRMVRFMMFRPFYEARPFHVFFRRMHAIPVEGGGGRSNDTSLEHARAEIAAGHTVCIFAEGAITRTGLMLGFRRGLERIMDGIDAPIIPVCLDGLWGSLFSFEGGRVLLKWPRRFRHPIQVLFGAPLPASASAFEVRQAVQSLSVDAVELREEEFRTLPVELMRSAGRNALRPFLADQAGRRFSYLEATLAALRLRDRLVAWGIEPGERVAVRMDTDSRAAITELALLLRGAVPVNLPPGVSAPVLAVAREAGASHLLVTSAEPDLGFEHVHPVAEFFEGLRPLRGPRNWLRAAGLLLVPPSWIARLALWLPPRAVRHPAVVVFSRGTTGAPKGVVLSHFNVLSNLRAFRQVFDVGPEDRVLGVMSFASAFGFTGTLCLPAYAGASVAYVADPLDVAALESVGRATPLTLIFALPPLLARYARELPREALAANARIVSGGQHLPEELRRALEEHFGAEPLEGYGLSECAPLVSINLPDVEIGTSRQQASAPGSGGHPLPGVAVRVIDPATGDDLPADGEGDLLVRGPNVMSGYVGDAGGGADEGWVRTGDVASIDRSGFLTLIDRRERMLMHPKGSIPLSRLEDALRSALGMAADEPRATQFCAVPRGDEANPGVSVLYEDEALDPDAAREALRASDCPDHWIPEREDFVRVAELPRTAWGGVDVARARELASAHV